MDVNLVFMLFLVTCSKRFFFYPNTIERNKSVNIKGIVKKERQFVEILISFISGMRTYYPTWIDEGGTG